jgi:hypothetical protein
MLLLLLALRVFQALATEVLLPQPFLQRKVGTDVYLSSTPFRELIILKHLITPASINPGLCRVEFRVQFFI